MRTKIFFFGGVLFATIFFASSTAHAASISRVKGLTVVATTETSIAVQWASVIRAKKYRIRVKNQESTQLFVVKTKKTSATIDNLTAGTTYTVQARAMRGDQRGAWSKIIATQTAAAVQEPVAQTIDVAIEDFAFSSDAVTINVGDTIRWTNHDSTQHSVVSDDGSFTSSDLLSTGDTYEVTFSAPGTTTYHCSPHSFMTGTITVEE